MASSLQMTRSENSSNQKFGLWRFRITQKGCYRIYIPGIYIYTVKTLACRSVKGIK